MFIHNTENALPIHIWCASAEQIEDSCMEQALHLAKLPFAAEHIALMPDTHTGKGMPIGGVLACEGVIVPNAVGVDIGCGMGFVQTNIPVKLLRETMTGSGSLLHNIIGNILRGIPTGRAHYKTPQPSAVLDRAHGELDKYEADAELLPFLESGYYQVGTLGGGNHFIELQEDEDGMCCIMLHSGSRHFGNEVGQYFNRLARALNQKWYASVPSEWGLPFLPVDTDEGKRYLNWMQLSMDYAFENRAVMLAKVKEIFSTYVEKYTELTPAFSDEINCHHNYAALETHFGKDVWVHRKGAVRAAAGELAVIPGAMGSYSYVVRGLGNPESFCTSSHGAGRKYSRTTALEQFRVDTVMNDLKAQGVVLGKLNKQDVAEECRFAYKDIDEVMEQQKDLVEPIKKLFSVGVVKG